MPFPKQALVRIHESQLFFPSFFRMIYSWHSTLDLGFQWFPPFSYIFQLKQISAVITDMDSACSVQRAMTEGRATSMPWSLRHRRARWCWLALGAFSFEVAFTQSVWRTLNRNIPFKPLALTLGVSQAALAEDGESSGFNVFLLLVPVAVIALLQWVFSLRPKKEEGGDGYASTTLRGRDSNENLQRKIKAMEEEQRLEDLRTQKLLEAAKKAPRDGNFSDALDQECDLEDEDLYSSDLKAQLKAARD